MISALTTVFEYNVLRFHNGRLGAVNGMRPDGKVGCTSLFTWVGLVAIAEILPTWGSALFLCSFGT